MFSIYLELAGAGVIVKQHGTIYANTTTGQLTTVFKEAPQVPVSDLQVHFKGGLRASLATPQQCGEYDDDDATSRRGAARSHRTRTRPRRST